MKTIFEQIIEREIPADIIYEDDQHIAFLNITPFEKGHTLVCPKKPYETIFDMSQDEYGKLQEVVHYIATHIKNILDCDMNIAQNNGHYSGQEVNHVHVHVVPRATKKDFYAGNNDDEYREGEKSALGDKLRITSTI